MGITETAETWVRVDLFCDGLDDHGSYLFGTGHELEGISDVAPTSEGARKAILNAAAKACWHFDPKLQQWLCPACAGARDVLKRSKDNGMTDALAAVPQDDRVLEEFFGASSLM
jgi:hypothetical protein